MIKQTVIQAIDAALQARRNCERSGTTEWFQKWSDRLDWIEREILPSGSGIDSGTTINRDRKDGIVLETSFHHMNEHGYYDGWTDHIVHVTPDFTGIGITVTGPDKNDIREYLADTFHHVLTSDIADRKES